MKYIYGPLNSRRLGLSLGINLIPYKTCNFDCIYCQLGKTTHKISERKEYINIEEIFNEFKLCLQTTEKLDYITLSGSGEPTLNLQFSQLIKKIKEITSIPVAIITNASLLSDPSVRQELKSADLILPTLNTYNQEIFLKINRPLEQIRIEDIIRGLIDLRKEFFGKIWLEIMLVKGINDNLRQIKKLKPIIDEIKPDKIHLNSPVRSTSEPNVFGVPRYKLKKIQEIFGENCQII